MPTTDDGVDFALAAYLEEGVWTVRELIHHHLADVDSLANALRRLNPDELGGSLTGDTGGTVGLVAIDEEFFVIVRVAGPSTRVLLSDVAAADDWDLAGSVVDFLGVPVPDPEDDDDQDDDLAEPVGDLSLLADLGMTALEMSDLLDDDELYPDEMLSEVARQLGFGPAFDDAVGLTSA